MRIRSRHLQKLLILTLIVVPILDFLGGSAMPSAQQAQRGPAWKLHVIDDSAAGADGARLMDVNGDKLPDIATGFEEGNRVGVMLHPGFAKVRDKWPTVTVGKVKSPEDAVFVDLDGDGRVDVVSCCEGKTNSVYVHWAPKEPARYLDANAWQTEAFPATLGLTQWMFAKPMQIDGKNGVDIIVGSKNKNGQIGWLQAPLNPRKLADWKFHPLVNAGWIMSLVTADMDGDGDEDVLLSDRKGKLSGCGWLENPGPGPAQLKPWKHHRIGAAGDPVMFLDYADLDGDGLRDVIVPTSNRKLLFYKRLGKNGNDWQRIEIRYPDKVGTGKAVRVADVNLDGKLDLVVAFENASGDLSGIVWMSYRKSAADTDWNVHELSGPLGIKFDLIQLVDLDGDGDLDVINTEERARGSGLGVVWYENPTR